MDGRTAKQLSGFNNYVFLSLHHSWSIDRIFFVFFFLTYNTRLIMMYQWFSNNLFFNTFHLDCFSEGGTGTGASTCVFRKCFSLVTSISCCWRWLFMNKSNVRVTCCLVASGIIPCFKTLTLHKVYQRI